MIISAAIKTNAIKEKIEKIGNNEYKIFVRTLPIGGKANKRIAELLSVRFCVSKSSINIVKGLKSNKKIIEIK